ARRPDPGFRRQTGALIRLSADYASVLRRWTFAWQKKAVSEIYTGDARDVLKVMEAEGKSRKYQSNIRNMINVVFDWGMEERLIKGSHESPARGIKVANSKGEPVPDIFTIEEIRKLLIEGKRLEHKWFHIWAVALLTGMRNGELHALVWSDVDLENRRITVSRSYNTRMKIVKCTKAGYWRNVPISDELHALLSELKLSAGNREHVLPRFSAWNKGEQARILRTFCIGVGLPSIRFHALRACFATQLLAHDIAPARVMKIAGWKDLKTMQRYVRLAGIDERGATQVLRVMPSDAAVMAEVVNLLGFRARQE
ncbi:MAG: site-specific integrase, partial [Bdellovibrionota bacterium]